MDILLGKSADRTLLFREEFLTPLGTINLLTNCNDVPQLIAIGGLMPKHIRWLDRRHGNLTWDLADRAGVSRAQKALHGYFSGDLGAIEDLRADPGGSPFQEVVWNAIRRIPPGSVLSTRTIAAFLGRASAYRALAYAAAINPVPILVPSHRVVDTTGEVGGYGADAAPLCWLLRHEGVECDGRFARSKP